MQAKRWPTCFQARYAQQFQLMSTSPYVQLMTLAVEPVSYMENALVELGDRRKGVGTPDFRGGYLANEIQLGAITECYSVSRIVNLPLVCLIRSISMKDNSRLQLRKRKGGDTM